MQTQRVCVGVATPIPWLRCPLTVRPFLHVPLGRTPSMDSVRIGAIRPRVVRTRCLLRAPVIASLCAVKRTVCATQHAAQVNVNASPVTGALAISVCCLLNVRLRLQLVVQMKYFYSVRVCARRHVDKHRRHVLHCAELPNVSVQVGMCAWAHSVFCLINALQRQRRTQLVVQMRSTLLVQAYANLSVVRIT